MKAFIAFSMVLAVSSALTSTHFKTAPTSYNSKSFKTTPVAFKRASVASGSDVAVLSQTSDIKPDGHYSYQYKLGNGISASENGLGGQNVNGNFQYTSPEGEPITITYTADENGYQAHGSHVPEIPPYILKSLEYIRTHAPHDDTKHFAASTKSFVATPASKPYKAASTKVTAYKSPAAKVTAYKAPAVKSAPTFKSTQTNTFKVPAKTAYKAPVKTAYKAPVKAVARKVQNPIRRF